MRKEFEEKIQYIKDAGFTIDYEAADMLWSYHCDEVLRVLGELEMGTDIRNMGLRTKLEELRKRHEEE